MFYYIDQPRTQPRTPSFPIGLDKTESEVVSEIVRSVETGLGR